MKNHYVGILYDQLTNEVKPRIVGDLLGCLKATHLFRRQLVICTTAELIDCGLLDPLPIDVSTDMSLPSLCLTYRVEEWADVPDQCETLIQRDLHVGQKGSNLHLGPHGNPKLQDYGNRISYSNLNRIWNHPNGYAPPDAAMIMMWGPVKA